MVLYPAIIFLAITIYMLVGPYEKTRVLFESVNFGSIVFTLVIVGGLVFSLYHYFDKRIKLVINKNGVWSLKNGQINWDQVWYFHIQISDDRYKSETLCVKQKDTDTEIKIGLGGYDISKDAILSSFKYYSSQHSIHDLGVGVPETGIFRN